MSTKISVKLKAECKVTIVTLHSHTELQNSFAWSIGMLSWEINSNNEVKQI